MKVLYHYHSPDTQGIKVEGGNVIIYASKPAIVHPGEIIRVLTNTSLKTEAGYYLFFSTHPKLVQKACQIFSAHFFIDEKAPDKPLEVPVTNCGRNPVNIMPGQELVLGRLMTSLLIELETFQPQLVPDKPNNKSTPQKKNVGVQFEIK